MTDAVPIPTVFFVDLENPSSHLHSKYNLLSNIVYETNTKTYKAQIQNKAPILSKESESLNSIYLGNGGPGGNKRVKSNLEETSSLAGKWFTISDLIVEEVLGQMLFLGESYIQVRASEFFLSLSSHLSLSLTY